ncbi:MAG TPA: hypothetical protein VEN99_04205 [Acidimicrobiia bacterium]|nr:hypothetical protein [Acidimicrobiia bacterium]
MAVLPPLIRRVPAAALALALGLALGGLAAPPAWAHAGDGLSQPIFEHMAPTVAGVDVQVAFSANYELLVSNRTPEILTFLADSGEPFLQIGPAGVLANFASPTFYDSNVPEGLSQFPEQARPGPDVPPIWHKVAAQPSWGWYDHRLHPAAQTFVPPEIRKANKVAVLGRWTVPLRYGAQSGELAGRFEFRPPTGSYAMVQKSSPTPAAGVKIQVVSASTVPAVFVENLSPRPLVVLGKDHEPFARIGPTITEVNVKSPTWAEVRQAAGQDPSDEADSSAEPKWQQVSDAPRWSWLEFRAAAPKSDPPPAVVQRNRATTVRNWSIPYLLGDQPGTVEGITQFVPIAQLRRQVPGASTPGRRSKVWLYAGLGLAAAVLGASGWLITSIRRSRTATKGEPWTS